MIDTRVIYWECDHCHKPIYKGETARCEAGRFYHLPCWEKHVRPKPDEWDEHVSQHTTVIYA